jgi:hypothetical protein
MLTFSDPSVSAMEWVDSARAAVQKALALDPE